MHEVIQHRPPVLTFDGQIEAVKGFYNLYDALEPSGIRHSDALARVELVALLDGEIVMPLSGADNGQYQFKAVYEFGPISGTLDHETGVLKLNTYAQVPHVKLHLRLHVHRRGMNIVCDSHPPAQVGYEISPISSKGPQAT